ncbi:MAG: NAD(P)-dependent oxidoreductase [bacterium]
MAAKGKKADKGKSVTAGKKKHTARRKGKKRKAKPAAGGRKRRGAGAVVLVTGAAGFVGSSMVEEMTDAGHAVVATDLPGSNLGAARKAGAKVVEADFTATEDAARLFESKVDYVVHVAALYDLSAERRDLMRVNRDGTRNVAESALDAGVKQFFYFSTGDIHGQVDGLITEDTPPNPLNAYAESKWAGEKLLWRLHRLRNLPLTVIRPTVIYGPRCRYTASNFFCIPGVVYAIQDRLGRDVRELPVFSDGPRISWVHVRDVTGAVRFLMGKPGAVGKAFNIADDDPMTLEEIFTLIFEAFGYKWVPARPYPTRLVAAIGRIGMNMPRFSFDLAAQFMGRNWRRVQEKLGLSEDLKPSFSRDYMSFMLGDRVFDNSRIKEAGYRFRYPDSREGFRETFEWYRARRWLPEPGELWGES